MADRIPSPEPYRAASPDRPRLLAEALDHVGDVVRVFRRRDDLGIELVYWNRSAVRSRTVTERELAEALVDPQGEVLRPGPCAEAVHAMKVWSFAASDGDYLVAIERDATEHDRLERAYDDVVAQRRRRRERTVHRVRNIALVVASPLREIRPFLEFMLAELGMTTVVLAITTAAKTYRWTARDEQRSRLAIPESIVASARTSEHAVTIARSEDAPGDIRFVSARADAIDETSIVISFAVDGADASLSDEDSEFLMISAELMAGMASRLVPTALQKARVAKRVRYRPVTA